MAEKRWLLRFHFGHWEIVATACNMVFIRKQLVHAATQHSANSAVLSIHLCVCQVVSHVKVPKIVLGLSMETHKLVETVHSQHDNGQNLAKSIQCWSHFDSCSDAHFEALSVTYL